MLLWGIPSDVTCRDGGGADGVLETPSFLKLPPPKTQQLVRPPHTPGTTRCQQAGVMLV